MLILDVNLTKEIEMTVVTNISQRGTLTYLYSYILFPEASFAAIKFKLSKSKENIFHKKPDSIQT